LGMISAMFGCLVQLRETKFGFTMKLRKPTQPIFASR
jgi:hypothetical protein